MKVALACASLLALSISLRPSETADPTDTTYANGEPDWQTLASLPDATWPAAQEKLDWRGDFELARQEAQRTGRPLFVTFRCLPCKQCAEFDQDVLEGGPELGPLLRQFITVRLVTMRDVDGRLFPYALYQDLDLSWWGYFHDGTRPIAIYGGKDEVSDATRMSVPSLANTMRRVLNTWYADPRPQLSTVKTGYATPPVIDEFVGWESWAARGAEEADERECLHCHQVNEILRMPAIDAGEFDKETDFWSWPFPENVGLVLDRDDGLRVTEVDPGGPAGAIGLRVGDSLLGAGHPTRAPARGTEWTVLFGQADFRGALHRSSFGNEPARVELVWTRDDELLRGTLDLPEGWRASNMGWRKSVAEAAIGANIGFPWPLGVSGRDRRRLGIPSDALAVRAYYPKGPEGVAGKAGLRGHHVITAVNGESPNVVGRAFLVWFRLRFEPGERITLTVREDDGSTETVEYEAPRPVRF